MSITKKVKKKDRNKGIKKQEKKQRGKKAPCFRKRRIAVK